jgi:DNA sulfur modification protein DndD
MTTTLRILGWEAAGLRCPDHTINFESESDTTWPVTLIQMPNGTGKTTTLELLRIALSGGRGPGTLTPDAIRLLQQLPTSDKTGTFLLSLMCDERRYTIDLQFDFEEGTLDIHTTGPTGGKKNGFHPPLAVTKFLTAEFVNFFVFDGELAADLLDSTMTNADRAIEGLFQLRLLDEFHKLAEAHWRQETAGKSAVERRGLTKRANRLKQIETRIASVDAQHARDVDQYESLSTQKLEIENRFHERLAKQDEIQRDHLSRSKEHHELSDRTKREVATCLNTMRDPHSLHVAFAADLDRLRKSLDNAKLPENTSREFFVELANESECICGRPLDESLRVALVDRASRYLGSDDVGLLNAMKTAIATQISNPPGDAAASLDAAIKALGSTRTDRDQAKTRLEAVEQTGIANDPELREADERRRALDTKLIDVKRRVDRFGDGSPTDAKLDKIYGRHQLEILRKEAATKLAEITGTLALKRKIEALQSILSSAMDIASSNLNTTICSDANDRLAELMPDNALRIEKIDKCLRLANKTGASVGETLSVAYAFLATLYNRDGEHDLPFIVDSPAGPLDNLVRREIGTLAPKLSSQFIAFTITSERQNFLDPIRAAAHDQVQHLTIFRNSATELVHTAADHKHVITYNGVVVEGAEFFEQFHQEKELV